MTKGKYKYSNQVELNQNIYYTSSPGQSKKKVYLLRSKEIHREKRVPRRNDVENTPKQEYT